MGSNAGTMAADLCEIVPGISLAAPLDDADALLSALSGEISVSAELIDVGAGAVTTPRLTGWYGDPHATYTYTGITRFPAPWTPTLAMLRDRFNARFATALNSCLVGVYEDGSSLVDWHADDEAELRDRIVSLSLGARRTFLLRRGPQGEPIAVPLDHGSLLVMTVGSQREWQHAIPAETATGRRLNLTFRVIAAKRR